MTQRSNLTPATTARKSGPVLGDVTASSLPALSPHLAVAALRCITPTVPDAPPMPDRAVVRSPEARLVRAMVTDAQVRCVALARHVRSHLRGVALFANDAAGVRNVANASAEADEMRRWLTSDSHALHSLGWCCDVIESTSGIPFDRASVAKRLLAILDGDVVTAPLRRELGGNSFHEVQDAEHLRIHNSRRMKTRRRLARIVPRDAVA